MREETYELKHPVSAGDDVISKVTISRLKAKHLQYVPKQFLGADAEDGEAVDIKIWEMLPFIAAVLGLPREVVDELDVEDLVPLAEKMTSFLAGSLQTGKS